MFEALSLAVMLVRLMNTPDKWNVQMNSENTGLKNGHFQPSISTYPNLEQPFVVEIFI